MVPLSTARTRRLAPALIVVGGILLGLVSCGGAVLGVGVLDQAAHDASARDPYRVSVLANISAAHSAPLAPNAVERSIDSQPCEGAGPAGFLRAGAAATLRTAGGRLIGHTRVHRGHASASDGSCLVSIDFPATAKRRSYRLEVGGRSFLLDDPIGSRDPDDAQRLPDDTLSYAIGDIQAGF